MARVGEHTKRAIWRILQDYCPTLTLERTALMIQACVDAPAQSNLLTMQELMTISRLSRYHINLALGKAAIQPAEYRVCRGGKQPLYEGKTALDALGFKGE